MQKDLPIIMTVLADYTGRLTDGEIFSGLSSSDSYKQKGAKKSWKWSLISPSVKNGSSTWKTQFGMRK